jgi:ornithine carbamoyltransferase
LSSSEELGAAGILDIFAAARRLRAQSYAGVVDRPLVGRNLALLRTSPSSKGVVSVLHRAALDLGARVAELRFGDLATPPPGELRALSRMLGRMYDAIDCGTLAPTLVRQIERDAGVPVYEGLDRDDHPARVLADLMTLYEHGLPPAPGMSILFVGDPHTVRGDTFLAAAREVGFDVRVGAPQQKACNDAAFVVDATHPSGWAIHAPPAALDELERLENHRFVLQTVLIHTIATV